MIKNESLINKKTHNIWVDCLWSRNGNQDNRWWDITTTTIMTTGLRPGIIFSIFYYYYTNNYCTFSIYLSSKEWDNRPGNRHFFCQQLELLQTFQIYYIIITNHFPAAKLSHTYSDNVTKCDKIIKIWQVHDICQP